MSNQRIYTSDNINAVARAFSAIVRRDLPEHLPEINRRNATEEYQHGACAVHDFCDGNMLMEEAFISVVGCEVDGNNDEHVDLWNAAYETARKGGFSL